MNEVEWRKDWRKNYMPKIKAWVEDPENAGIVKSLQQQIGAGVGNINTPGSSLFIAARDPGRAIRRGRQLFQRKFTEEGHHSSRIDIDPPTGFPRLDAISLYPVDHDYIETNAKLIKAKFNEIFQ